MDSLNQPFEPIKNTPEQQEANAFLIAINKLPEPEPNNDSLYEKIGGSLSAVEYARLKKIIDLSKHGK